MFVKHAKFMLMEINGKDANFNLLFPYYILSITIKDSLSNLPICLIYPVDTGRKLNIHKTFRKRPGHLLNVLCKFSLRPVSTGYQLVHSPHVLDPSNISALPACSNV